MTTTENQIQTCNREAGNRSEKVYTVRPQYDVKASNEAYVVTVFMPGVSRENTSITVDKDTLEVHGQRVITNPSQEWKVLHKEIPEADFRLRLELNAPVDRDSISARTENGVLTVTLPVIEAAKPRQIEIN